MTDDEEQEAMRFFRTHYVTGGLKLLYVTERVIWKYNADTIRNLADLGLLKVFPVTGGYIQGHLTNVGKALVKLGENT